MLRFFKKFLAFIRCMVHHVNFVILLRSPFLDMIYSSGGFNTPAPHLETALLIGAKQGVLNPTAIPYENTISRCSAAGLVIQCLPRINGERPDIRIIHRLLRKTYMPSLLIRVSRSSSCTVMNFAAALYPCWNLMMSASSSSTLTPEMLSRSAVRSFMIAF